MNHSIEQYPGQTLSSSVQDRIGTCLEKFTLTTPEEIGLSRGAWEMFQNPEIIKIYADCYRWQTIELQSARLAVKQLPGIGMLSAKLFSPEAVLDSEWPALLMSLNVGEITTLTNQTDPLQILQPLDSSLFSFIIDLKLEPDELYLRVERRGRRAIERSDREGMVMKNADNINQIRQYHELMLRITDNGKRYDVPPLVLLENLFNAGYGRLYLATLSDRIIGGVFVVADHYTHGLCSGFDFSATNLPSNLLYWHTCLCEREKGSEFLDLGPQTPGENEHLIKFKRSFSPYLVPAYRYKHYPSPWRNSMLKTLRLLKPGNSVS